MLPSPNLISLQYAPAPRGLRAIHWKRWAILLAIAASLSFAAARIVPRACDYFRAVASERAALRACMEYTRSPGQLVFDESVHRRSVALYYSGKASGHDSPAYRSSRENPYSTKPEPGESWDLLSMPNAWREKLDAQFQQHRVLNSNAVRCGHGLNVHTPWVDHDTGHTEDERCSVLLFMHERQSPSGLNRLTMVTFDAPAFLCDQPRPFRVFANAEGLGSWVACANFAPPPDQPVRLYAGQPDPIDPARFTIPVKIGDADSLIEGRLCDDETITLTWREKA